MWEAIKKAATNWAKKQEPHSKNFNFPSVEEFISWLWGRYENAKNHELKKMRWEWSKQKNLDSK